MCKLKTSVQLILMAPRVTAPRTTSDTGSSEWRLIVSSENIQTFNDNLEHHLVGGERQNQATTMSENKTRKRKAQMKLIKWRKEGDWKKQELIAFSRVALD